MPVPPMLYGFFPAPFRWKHTLSTGTFENSGGQSRTLQSADSSLPQKAHSRESGGLPSLNVETLITSGHIIESHVMRFMWLIDNQAMIHSNLSPLLPCPVRVRVRVCVRVRENRQVPFPI